VHEGWERKEKKMTQVVIIPVKKVYLLRFFYWANFYTTDVKKKVGSGEGRGALDRER